MSLERRILDHFIASYASEGIDDLEKLANDELQDYSTGPVEVRHEVGYVADPEDGFKFTQRIIEQAATSHLDSEMHAHHTHPLNLSDDDGVDAELPVGITPGGEFIFDPHNEMDSVPEEARAFYVETEIFEHMRLLVEANLGLRENTDELSLNKIQNLNYSKESYKTILNTNVNKSNLKKI